VGNQQHPRSTFPELLCVEVARTKLGNDVSPCGRPEKGVQGREARLSGWDGCNRPGVEGVDEQPETVRMLMRMGRTTTGCPHSADEA
jgi:hypothetical protein